MMTVIKRFSCISIIGWIVFSTTCYAQQLQRSQAITAYIYNFAKNVQWQNEDSMKEFRFLYIGNEKDILNDLTVLSKTRMLRNKPIIVSADATLADIEKAQLIFVAKSEESSLPEIYGRIEGKNILLISDEYRDKRLIMINFFASENSTLQFEINKANILNQHLRIMEDMILLGGTEIDVAALYREGQQSLRTLQKHTEDLESNIQRLKDYIVKRTKELKGLQDSLLIQTQKSQAQQKILDSQSLELKKRETELAEQIKKINEQQKVFDLESQELQKQKDELRKGSELLLNLTEKINHQKSEIKSQSKILEEQGKTISRQQNFLYLLAIIMILTALLVFAVYKGYQNKKKLNRELEIKVEDRTTELRNSNEQLKVELTERIRAQNALKESEILYRYMFEQSPVPMLVYELGSLKLLAVNDAFTSHYGYTKPEALKLLLTDLYPEYEKNAITELSAKLQGHAYAGEWHHVKKDGTLISIEARSHQFIYEEKKSRIAVITDITERKRAEEKLRQSEEQFRLISENVADMIVVLDLDGKRIYSNPSYEPILGDTNALPGTDSFKEIHPEDRETIKELFKETIALGKGKRAEYRLISKNGGVHFIESQGSVIRDSSGKITMVVVVSRDITERKKTDEELGQYRKNLEEMVMNRTLELQKSNDELSLAKKAIEDVNKELLKEIEVRKLTQEELSLSERRHEDILNYAPILVYINDVEGRYIFVNKEFERVMGLSLDEVINKTDLELFPPHRADRNVAQNKKVISTRQAQLFENASQKKDGTHHFVDILFPIFDSHVNITATCGWSIDITERKKNEEVLKDAKEKAESADRLKSAFLATMSHELRTPLNSIIGFTGILMKGIAGALNEEQLKQLGMVKGSAQHLLELINDVLDISKIEAGQLVVTNRKFDLSKTIKKIVSTVQPMAEKKNLKLYLNIAEDVKEIDSDERRVGQILLNIINNAVKFTDIGSVKIDAVATEKNVITKITDTGIGIKKEDMDKLFKPFSQIDTGLTRNHEGTGLGLSISQKLIEKLGGAITVESEVGVGSTFTVMLPIVNN